MKIVGKVYKYGDDIDTDRIIPGKYTKTMNLNELAEHAMEDLDPDFKNKFISGGIIAAGSNFGCGSSREQAPLALKQVGVAAVAAKSFARIFFRNAINIGLVLVECNTDLIADGEVLEIDLNHGKVHNKDGGATLEISPMPQVMQDILEEGGLVSYLKAHKTYSI